GRVWGFVLSTEEVWRRRYYFFVNRRPVRNRTLYRAARETLQGEGGMVFLFLELPPSQLDVHIHPAQAAVRFRDDVAAYDLVRGALQRRALPSWLQTGRVAEPEAAYSSGEGGGFTLIGQVEDTFLLTLAERHLYLLDQHAAEERVLYERLQQGEVQSRELIAPQVVTLSPEERIFLDER